jgi:hypothetical protein
MYRAYFTRQSKQFGTVCIYLIGFMLYPCYSPESSPLKFPTVLADLGWLHQICLRPALVSLRMLAELVLLRYRQMLPTCHFERYGVMVKLKRK